MSENPENNHKKHFSSWMFYDGPKDHQADNIIETNETNETNQNLNQNMILTPPKPPYSRFSCGHCSTIMSVQIPIDSSSNSNHYYNCPNCGTKNLIPIKSNTSSSTSSSSLTSSNQQQNTSNPHYSSWMFFSTPGSISSNNNNNNND